MTTRAGTHNQRTGKLRSMKTGGDISIKIEERRRRGRGNVVHEGDAGASTAISAASSDIIADTLGGALDSLDRITWRRKTCIITGEFIVNNRPRRDKQIRRRHFWRKNANAVGALRAARIILTTNTRKPRASRS